jgi:hypothetical protein
MFKQCIRDWKHLVDSSSDVDLSLFYLSSLVPISYIEFNKPGELVGSPVFVDMDKIEEIIGYSDVKNKIVKNSDKIVINKVIENLIEKGLIQVDINFPRRFCIAYTNSFSSLKYLFEKNESVEFGSSNTVNKVESFVSLPEFSNTVLLIEKILEQYKLVCKRSNKPITYFIRFEKHIYSLITVAIKNKMFTQPEFWDFFQYLSYAKIGLVEEPQRFSPTKSTKYVKPLLKKSKIEFLLKIVPFYLEIYPKLAKRKNIDFTLQTLLHFYDDCSLKFSEYSKNINDVSVYTGGGFKD